MSRTMDAPTSLFDDDRFLSRQASERLADQVFGMAQGGGITVMRLVSGWTGSVRWGRNRVTMAGDQRDNYEAWVWRIMDGRARFTVTNQIDEASLLSAVRNSERLVALTPGSPSTKVDAMPNARIVEPRIWSDATFDLDSASRGAAARALVEPAEAAGMLSAGFLSVAARGTLFASSHGMRQYARSTEAQCSVTVRDAKGLGSGWAGASSFDWAALDCPAVGARALDKCQRSMNPVVVEPGRYTVILEPQAVADLVAILLAQLDRIEAESGNGPFAADRGFAKLGRKVVDDRITIEHDPMDPLLGVLPFDRGFGDAIRPAKWIDRGTLTALSHIRERYSLPQLIVNDGLPNSGAFRMSGGTTTVEEMIRSTQRGLLVTRFSNIDVLDPGSLLATGVTRDGLWLVERGEITKTVKNLRFTESPLFMLNNLDQLGAPVPVFRPGLPAVVPPVKARDFSFTSLVDAI